MRRAALVVLAVSFTLVSCRALERKEVLYSVRSPSSTLIARVVEVKSVGGGIARPRFHVFVDSTRTERVEFNPHEAVWKSRDVYPVYIFWLDDETLEILVDGLSRGRFDQIVVRKKGGLRAMTRVLRTSSKASICDSNALEAVTPRAALTSE